ncbi:MAG: M20/M25/M40 family metallo-hydrolase [Sphaerochaetaceae bacterium]|nr:M20/M25/M40 family metallo-hydrolase [Sphaerochaetaceae bacterium]
MYQIDNKSIVDLFLKLVSIDSPSKNEGEIRSFIVDYLHRKNIRTAVDARGNIFAYLSDSYDEKAILFASHIDTVPSAVDVNPVCTEDEIHTDGKSALGADNKAAVASMLYAVDHLAAMKDATVPVVYLFSVSEETGLDGVRELDLSLLPPVSEAFIPDAHGPIGNIIAQSPAKLDASITFHGKTAHAGFCPEEGISAISLASRAIDQMKLLRIDETTTANIGTISGGTVTNIVPDSCTIHLEVRSDTKEKCYAHLAHLELCCIKAVGALGGSYDIESDLRYPGYSMDENQKPIIHLQKVFSAMGFEGKMIASGGGSDTNILRDYGIDALTISSGYTHAHSEQERIPLSAFCDLTKIILDLAKRES